MPIPSLRQLQDNTSGRYVNLAFEIIRKKSEFHFYCSRCHWSVVLSAYEERKTNWIIHYENIHIFSLSDAKDCSVYISLRYCLRSVSVFGYSIENEHEMCMLTDLSLFSELGSGFIASSFLTMYGRGILDLLTPNRPLRYFDQMFCFGYWI